MNTMRIGPVELVLLVFLSIGLGLVMTTGKGTLLLAVVVGSALMVASVLSTYLSLFVLIVSMLLSPEINLGAAEGGGVTAQRGVTLRFEDFLLIVIGLVWLAKAAIRKQEAPLKWTTLNGPIMFYVAVFLFATLVGVLAGRVRATTGFFFCLKYFEYFFIYFMVVNSVTSQKQAKSLIIASFLVCFVVSLFAIAQIPTGQRASAPFEGKEGEPNTLGGYLVFMLSIAAGFLMTPGATKNKFHLLILLGAGSVALLATLSRSSFLAAGVVTLTILVLVSYRKPLLLVGLLCVMMASPWWLPGAVKNRVLYTFTQAPEKGQIQIGTVKVDTSTSDRIRSWEQSYQVWRTSPIWGLGVTGGPFMDAMYPRVLTESGTLGVLSFLSLIWTLFRLGRTTYRQAQDPYFRGLAIGFLLGLEGLLVHSIGSNAFIIVRIMEPFWLYAALVARGPHLVQGVQVEGSEPQLATGGLGNLAARSRVR